MSARVRKAVARFVDGYSCAQALLSVYGPDLGLDERMAMKIASPLGGGLSRTDGLCGAATGAILVLGCALGHEGPGDDDGKARMIDCVQEFLRLYEERKGSTMCTDILGHNLSQPGVPEMVKAEGLSKEPCPEAVRTAAELLEELLEGELR